MCPPPGAPDSADEDYIYLRHCIGFREISVLPTKELTLATRSFSRFGRDLRSRRIDAHKTFTHPLSLYIYTQLSKKGRHSSQMAMIPLWNSDDQINSRLTTYSVEQKNFLRTRLQAQRSLTRRSNSKTGKKREAGKELEKLTHKYETVFSMPWVSISYSTLNLPPRTLLKKGKNTYEKLEIHLMSS